MKISIGTVRLIVSLIMSLTVGFIVSLISPSMVLAAAADSPSFITCRSDFADANSVTSDVGERSPQDIIHRGLSQVVLKGRAVTLIGSLSLVKTGNWRWRRQRKQLEINAERSDSLNFQIFPNNEATLWINWKAVAIFDALYVHFDHGVLVVLAKLRSANKFFIFKYKPRSKRLVVRNWTPH